MAHPVLMNGVTSAQDHHAVLDVAATNQTRAEGHHPVGTRGALPDGRVFYYASNGAAALTAGSLLMVPVTTGLNRHAAHNDITVTDSFANFAAGVRRGIVLQESDVDSADIITNEYKDGYLYMEDGTGEGHTYKIERHSQFDFSGTATSGTIDLYDPIVVTPVTGSQISFARNPYDRVITSGTAFTETIVGVAPVAVTGSTALATDVTTTVAATTTRFFWAQTWGPCAVEVADTTLAVGLVAMSGGTADRIAGGAGGAHTSNATSLDGFDRPHIGWGLVSAAAGAGDFVLVQLRINP